MDGSERWGESRHVVSDRVYRITLDRPEQRNALTPRLYGELKSGILRAENDPAVDCIVIEGADGVFASGGDLKILLEILEMPTPERLAAFIKAYDEPLPFRSILDCTKPVIAEIDGLCLAGGVILALAADVAIATDETTFALPEARVGVGDSFSPVILPKAVGLARARYMMLTGKQIDARTAEDWGLILKAVPRVELSHEVQHIIDELRAASPDSIRLYKQTVNRDLVGLSGVELYRLFGGHNCREGLRAFVEKRSPRWVRDPRLTT